MTEYPAKAMSTSKPSPKWCSPCGPEKHPTFSQFDIRHFRILTVLQHSLKELEYHEIPKFLNGNPCLDNYTSRSIDDLLPVPEKINGTKQKIKNRKMIREMGEVLQKFAFYINNITKQGIEEQVLKAPLEKVEEITLRILCEIRAVGLLKRCISRKLISSQEIELLNELKRHRHTTFELAVAYQTFKRFEKYITLQYIYWKEKLEKLQKKKGMKRMKRIA